MPCRAPMPRAAIFRPVIHMRPYDASPCLSPDRKTAQARKFRINRANTRHGGRGLLPGEKQCSAGAGAKIVTYQWADCGRDVVARRYDRIAKFIPLFDWLFFVPWDLRRKAVGKMRLSRGDSVLEIGCGTGPNL